MKITIPDDYTLIYGTTGSGRNCAKIPPSSKNSAADLDAVIPDILDELPNLDEMPGLNGAMPSL